MSKDSPRGTAEGQPERRARPCPICKRMSVREYHPFCSKRCADIDLNRWLTGSYAIPVVEEDKSVPEEGDE